MVDSAVCMSEMKTRHIDATVADDFKGCCNDSALVCTLRFH